RRLDRLEAVKLIDAPDGREHRPRRRDLRRGAVTEPARQPRLRLVRCLVLGIGHRHTTAVARIARPPAASSPPPPKGGEGRGGGGGGGGGGGPQKQSKRGYAARPPTPTLPHKGGGSSSAALVLTAPGWTEGPSGLRASIWDRPLHHSVGRCRGVVAAVVRGGK